MKIEFHPIGVIHTPFTKPEGMPIQPAGVAGVTGTVEVFEDYRAGLKDLNGFSHIILLYHFHRSEGFNLQVEPFMDRQPRGLFATRAPKRPSPIGLSVVKLDKIENGTLHVQNLDILDGTPLLDPQRSWRWRSVTGDIPYRLPSLAGSYCGLGFGITAPVDCRQALSLACKSRRVSGWSLDKSFLSPMSSRRL